MSRGSRVREWGSGTRVSDFANDPPIAISLHKALMKGAAVGSGLFLFIMAAFALAMAGGSALAKAGSNEPKNLPGVPGFIPLEKIIDKAMAQHSGHLIEAELKSLKGQDVYEIELLDEGGKVWEMYYNAKTGELLKQGGGEAGEDSGH